LRTSFFDSREKKRRKSNLAKAVIVLTKATGMSEKEILDLPAERIRTYLEAIRELNNPE